MDQAINEKIKLSSKDILLGLVDIAVFPLKIFGYSYHRKIAYAYEKWREENKADYYKQLWRLEKQGYIKRYQKEKGRFAKLTKLGEKQALKYLSDDFFIVKPKKWDKKWHIVIFDIPNDKKNLRDVMRLKLKKLGFLQLQKSVFVYPFNCLNVIRSLKYIYGLSSYIQYIIAEDIESEIDLVSYFYDKGIISSKF